MPSTPPKKDTGKSYILIWSILIFSAYLVIYEFRALDHNIYFNWNYIFENVSRSGIFILLLASILLSYIISDTGIGIDKKYVLPSIFLGAFLLGAVFWSAPEASPGVATYFTEAKYLKEYGISTFIRDWGGKLDTLSDFPVVPFIFGLILKFIGESKIYIQIFTTTMFAGTGVLTYLIAWRLWDEKTGIYAALFLLSFPYLLLKTSFTLVDVPTMFFVAAAIYATLNAMETWGTSRDMGRIWILASVTFIVLVFLSKISAWIMLGTVPAIFLIYYIKRGTAILYPAALISLLSVTLITAFVYYKIDVLLKIFEYYLDFRIRLQSFNESLWSLLFFQVSPLVTLLAGFSFYIALKKRDIKYVLLLTWFWVPFISLSDTRIRYMVPALPALAIMAAITLNEIKPERTKKFVSYSIVICSIMLAVLLYLPFTYTFSSMNIKNAAEYTNNLDIERIEVYAAFPDGYIYNLDMLLPIFDLHSKKDIATPKYRRNKPPPDAIPWWWSYKFPWPYYSKETSPESAIVIISPRVDQPPPELLEKRLEEGYRLAKVYSAGYTGINNPYVVRVFLPVKLQSP